MHGPGESPLLPCDLFSTNQSLFISLLKSHGTCACHEIVLASQACILSAMRATLLCLTVANAAAQSLRTLPHALSSKDSALTWAQNTLADAANPLQDDSGSITVWRDDIPGVERETIKFQRTTFGKRSLGTIGDPGMAFGAELVAFSPGDGCAWPTSTLPPFMNTTNVRRGTPFPDKSTSPHGWVALISWRGPQSGACYLADKASVASEAGASAVVRPPHACATCASQLTVYNGALSSTLPPSSSSPPPPLPPPSLPPSLPSGPLGHKRERRDF